MKQPYPFWRVDNLIPTLLLLGSFFLYLNRLSVVETKLDNLISQQTELTKEFRDWRKQSETRLGVAESNLDVVGSALKLTLRR